MSAIRGRAAIAVACMTVSLLSAGGAAATPGNLDLSYGLGTGGSRIDLGQNEIANAVALQPDGKIILGGETVSSTQASDVAVVRLNNPAGTFDSSFGAGDGVSKVDLGANEFTNAIALQPDGKIIVAGARRATDGKSAAAFVARLGNPAGTLDLNYGGGFGWSQINFPGQDTATANAVVLQQPDGKIILAGGSSVGSQGASDVLVARLNNPQGTFDPTFGPSTGVVRVDLGQDESASSLALQPDGKILVAGTQFGPSGQHVFVARLLSPQGTMDTSFGSGAGHTTLAFGGKFEFGGAMVLQPDGKILVAATTNANGTEDFAVTRLQRDGQPDTSFGSDGNATIDFGGQDEATAMALQPDGKIVVAGAVTLPSGIDMLVVRLQGDPAGTGGGGGGTGGGGGGGGGGGSGPRLSRLRVSPPSVSIAGRLVNGQCAKPTALNKRHQRCRRAIKLHVTYSLTAAASVAFTLEREHAGRNVNGRCEKPVRSNHNHKRCTRLTHLPGKITQNAIAGSNTLTFNGTIAGHQLGPGAYQLTATPNDGTAQSVTFRIVG